MTLAPTHYCNVCGALWRQCDNGSWNLRSEKAGPCCDNVAMGSQISPLVLGSMTTPPEERDLAHEADMEALMRQQLRDNISHEEAAEECAEIEARAAWMEGADLDDGSDLLGDPDEYDEEDFECRRCRGDGRDPWTDYLMPCPECQAEQAPSHVKQERGSGR